MKRLLLAIAGILFLAGEVSATPIQADPGYFVTPFNAVSLGSAAGISQDYSLIVSTNGVNALTWQTVYSAAPASITVTLEGSVDCSSYSTVDTSTNTAGEIRSVFGSWRCVRLNNSAVGTGAGKTITAYIVYSSGKSVTTGSGSFYNGGTFTSPILLPDGDSSNLSLAFASTPALGIYKAGTAIIGIPSGKYLIVNPTVSSGGGIGFPGVVLGSTAGISWTATTPIAAQDTFLYRDAANTLAQKNVNNDQFFRIYGANGGYWEHGVNSELLTIAAAASTDTSGNLLPQDAVIESVVVRVVTVIPTATTFTVGDATTAGRFATGVSVAANTTAVGLLHRNPADADAAGPVQTSAAKVRITPNSTPATATGQVRIEVFFSRFVAPTS